MGKFSIFNFQFSFIIILAFYILPFGLAQGGHSTFYISPVYAHGDDIGEAQLNPASPLYFLKSVREILELKFADTTQAKGFRELEFANSRISEVKSLAKTSRQDLIEPTLARYLFHLNELLGKITLKDENMVDKVTDAAIAHMSVLQAIYPQVSEQRARMSVRATINSLSLWDQQLINILSKPQPAFAQEVLTSKLTGCNFLSKEASSSSLNEVERSVFSERAQKCLKSL